MLFPNRKIKYITIVYMVQLKLWERILLACLPLQTYTDINGTVTYKVFFNHCYVYSHEKHQTQGKFGHCGMLTPWLN
jgi:hypothetical protein